MKTRIVYTKGEQNLRRVCKGNRCVALKRSLEMYLRKDRRGGDFLGYERFLQLLLRQSSGENKGFSTGRCSSQTFWMGSKKKGSEARRALAGLT